MLSGRMLSWLSGQTIPDLGYVNAGLTWGVAMML